MAIEQPHMPIGIEAGEITENGQTVGIMTFKTDEGDFRFYVNDQAADAVGMALDLIKRKLAESIQ